MGEHQADEIWVATAIGSATLVVAAGFALAQTRSMALFLSLLSARPLWSKFDPIHVLDYWERVKKRSPMGDNPTGNEEAVEKMFG